MKTTEKAKFFLFPFIAMVAIYGGILFFLNEGDELTHDQENKTWAREQERKIANWQRAGTLPPYMKNIFVSVTNGKNSGTSRQTKTSCFIGVHDKIAKNGWLPWIAEESTDFVIMHEFAHCLHVKDGKYRNDDDKLSEESFADSFGLMMFFNAYGKERAINLSKSLLARRSIDTVSRGKLHHSTEAAILCTIVATNGFSKETKGADAWGISERCSQRGLAARKMTEESGLAKATMILEGQARYHVTANIDKDGKASVTDSVVETFAGTKTVNGIFSAFDENM